MRYTIIISIGMLLAFFVITGCVIRTQTMEVDRVDQTIEGNRGIIMGKVPIAEPSETKKTRMMYDIEIELPSLYEQTAEKNIDKSLTGNRGYVQGSAVPEREGVIPSEKSGVVRLRGLGQSNVPVPVVVYSEPVKKPSLSAGGEIGKEYYIVEKDDTLQKISKKFYGTTKKWKDIYNANRNILRDPDKLYVGQRLVIPKD